MEDSSMKNLQIVKGDFALNKKRHANVVKSTDKLIQDLTLFLLEPLGIGYTTPGFGSTLTLMEEGGSRMIGRFMNSAFIAEIQGEVDRVLNLYQQTQIEKIRTASLRGELNNYTKGEILNSIDSIQALMGQVPITVLVNAKIQSGIGKNINFLLESNETNTKIVIV